MRSEHIQGWGRVLVEMSDGELTEAQAMRVVAAIANDEAPPPVEERETGILASLGDLFGG